jgi:hypothetical protein
MVELDADIAELIANAPKAGVPQGEAPKAEQERLEKLRAKIPGLDLTYGDAEDLSLTEEDIKAIQETKKQYEASLHLIRTYKSAYLVRECSRIEWRNKLMEWNTSLQQAREQMAAENKDPNSIEQIVNMLSQERIVAWLLVHPKLEALQLRRLPPGEIETIFNGIMIALGFNQPVVPIRI